MFTTLVLMCSIATANDCVLLSDTRGPSPSKDACLARANEMIRDIDGELDFYKKPDHAGVSWSYKCEPVGGEGV